MTNSHSKIYESHRSKIKRGFIDLMTNKFKGGKGFVLGVGLEESFELHMLQQKPPVLAVMKLKKATRKERSLSIINVELVVKEDIVLIVMRN